MTSRYLSKKHVKLLVKSYKTSFRELPYRGVSSILSVHGQFNNSLPKNSLTTRKQLDNLPSLYDCDLFSLNLNTNLNVDPDQNILNNQVRCKYYSPISFYKEKVSLNNLSSTECSFSIFHNNNKSLRKNVENLQTHILEELEYSFSVIGLTETRITSDTELNFNYHLLGYVFEYVPTPLASGGIGMYIRNDLNCCITKKTSEEAFQALWIEIILPKKKNILCGVLYIKKFL